MAAGPDFVFGLIERHRIACNAVRTGLLSAANAAAGRRVLERRARYWEGRGAPVRMLDARATRAAIGSDAYEASCLDERGGHLNPFAYTVGLARAAAAAGAVIHTTSLVRAIARQGGRWHVETPDGALDAESIVIGTNAYSDAVWPGIRESIVPMRGHALVTRPPSSNVRAAILPGGQPVTDARHLFSGVRLLADGSLHVSSDGPAFGPEADAFRRQAAMRVAQLFPFLNALEWREAWSGWVAMTRDQFPHLHELAPGAFAALGYSAADSLQHRWRGVISLCWSGVHHRPRWCFPCLSCAQCRRTPLRRHCSGRYYGGTAFETAWQLGEL